MENIPNIKTSINDEALAGETYARILPELQKLSAEELVPINLDVPSVVATTLGALPEILALKSEILAQMPGFDVVTLNKLEDYALALNHAHGQFITATQPSDDLDAVTTEATELRETLFADATALARRGHVDGNRLKELTGTNGYKNLATDLSALGTILRDSWQNLQGRTGIELAELDRAAKLGQRILRIVGLREQGPVVVAAATEMRTRAFTLLVRAYDDARRAISFLRWKQGDAEKIAPSLYGGRKRRSGEAPDAVTPPTPAAPSPVSPSPASPATSAQPAPHPANNSAASVDPFLS